MFKKRASFKNGGRRGKTKSFEYFFLLMIPTEKGEAGNVCKFDENGKKRYNRINRSNSKIACS